MSTALRFTSLLLVTIGAAALAWANSSNPPIGHSGAPGEPTCAAGGCHDQYPLNSGPGAVELPPELFWYSPTGTCPPETTIIPVMLRHPGATRWGFELTVVDSAGLRMGTLYLADSTRTAIVDSTRSYVIQTDAGTDAGAPDSSNGWQVGWGPDWNSWFQPIRIYVAGVAADNDGTPAGDYVYTDSALLWVVETFSFCGVNGDLDLDFDVTSADIISLVNYIFSGIRPRVGGGILCDINCSGRVTAADVIYLLNHVFKGGKYPCNPCISCCDTGILTWSCP